MSKIIFLDIDGPMIPATMYLLDMNCSWKRQFPAHTVAVINKLCENTGAKIVFNTTHNRPMRNVPNIDDALVAQGLNPDHLHPTDRHTLYPEINRRQAVQLWLADHPEVTHWCAIDDAECAEAPHMILVDPDAGVHIGHLNLAASVLEGKPCIVLL